MISRSTHSGVKLHFLAKATNWLGMFLIALSLFSCGGEANEPEPKNAIPRKKLVDVLVDIHILESRAETTNVPKDSLLPEYKLIYGQIFQKNGVTAEQFQETFAWYEENPVKLDALYQEVVAELSRQDAESKGIKKVK